MVNAASLAKRLRRPQQATASRYGRWALIIALPLLLNMAVWHAVVQPQRVRVRELSEAREMTALKPRLEELLGESRLMLAQGEVHGFTSDDPMAVMGALERLAAVHRVQLKTLSAQGRGGPAQAQPAAAARGTLPVELEASGSFGKLARWLGAVESQVGLRVDSWAVAMDPSTESQRLSVKLTAFLQET